VASVDGLASLLHLPGTASTPAGTARANHVQVYGVGNDFWTFVGAPGLADLKPNAVVLNRALAAQLGVALGDEVILRVAVQRPISADAALAQHAPPDLALRLTVAGVLPAEQGGDLSLRSGGLPAFNAFVSVQAVAASPQLRNQANLMLAGPVLLSSPADQHRTAAQPAPSGEAVQFLSARFHQRLSLEDIELKLVPTADRQSVELRSRRVFLEPPLVEAVNRVQPGNAVFILTYLANLISSGTNATPYSMVTAASPPYVPSDMRDDEILVNQWLADDLGLKPGDTVTLAYFEPESGARLAEGTHSFRLRGVVPLTGRYADPTLMPDFPGIEKAESTHDWDAGFPLVHPIRPQDEEYWKKHRGTPKAFVTLAAGQKLWANRFGKLTALRFPLPAEAGAPGPTGTTGGETYRAELERSLLAAVNPAGLGFRFEPVRQQALAAADQAQDFGQLFLGFSLFLVVAALLLVALLFQLGLEQRATEVGTLLALGFTARQVRRLLLAEGAALALAGGILGALGGLGYARVMLWGLATVWRGAVGTTTLHFHVTASTLLVGTGASILVAGLTLWLTLRQQARRPAIELLSGESSLSSPAVVRGPAKWLAPGASLAAVLIAGWALASGETANAGAFFGAGSLLLVAGLAWAALWLGALARRTTSTRLTLPGLGMRACVRRRKRSLATIALLACGAFVIVAIGVFRLDANQDAERRTSGTGGFALVGESSLPVVKDLNRPSGREFFGLNATDLAGVQVVPFRVHEGDEASCLNLSRAQQPRLLGVRAELLAGRFTFASVAKGLERKDGWNLLRSHTTLPTPGSTLEEIPAIGDANSLEWALGKKLGDTLDYTDSRGRAFRLRLVGAVANSVLQGSLVIDETAFLQKFPDESGYRMFLLDAPRGAAARVAATLTRALEDLGLELTPAARRLGAFNEVQNTYLGTFQVLGGLGLLLGSAGLGVVLLRNVLERRGELGLLVAVGFRRGALQWLLLCEHAALLGLGLGLGLLAAAVAVLPAFVAPGRQLPVASLALTLGAVLANGGLWTWMATRYALRGNLLAALRNE
jgi:putative ABC transport system permease protein